jgi:hypothetical protein
MWVKDGLEVLASTIGWSESKVYPKSSKILKLQCPNSIFIPLSQSTNISISIALLYKAILEFVQFDLVLA